MTLKVDTPNRFIPPVNGITVYSKEQCSYCIKTKSLLSNKNIPFTEIKLNPEDQLYTNSRNELISMSQGHSTFPWIFIGDDFLGGFRELVHSFSGNIISTKLQNIGINYQEDDF